MLIKESCGIPSLPYGIRPKSSCRTKRVTEKMKGTSPPSEMNQRVNGETGNETLPHTNSKINKFGNTM